MIVKPSILFLSDYNFSVIGGAQKSMEIIMEGLSDQYDFYIIMPGREYRSSSGLYRCLNLPEYDVFRFGGSPKMMAKLTHAIKRNIDRVNPDIIHTQMVVSMGAITLLSTLGLLPMPLVHTDRGVLNEYGLRVRAALKQLSRTYSQLICTTNRNAAEYSKAGIVKAQDIRVIPNTAGPLFTEYKPNKEQEMKSLFGLSGPVFMFNARYTYEKNWDLSLEIIKSLSKKYNAKFILVASCGLSEAGATDIDELFAEVKSFVGDANVLCYRDLPLDKISDLYYAADFFILTSRNESFGRTAVEAMARHCVVLGTRVGGLPEVIGNERFLFDDLREFDAKIDAILKSDIARMKLDCRQRYQDCYSLERNLEQHAELYQCLLRGNASR